MTTQPITLSLDRSLLEHPEALHLRRMRMALWLYLALLGRLSPGSNVVQVNPTAIGLAMGLPEGTVRSWLGHLRKGRYIEIERKYGELRITMNRVAVPPASPKERLRPLFTIARLTRALGEKTDIAALTQVLANYPTETIQRALAGTLAVPEDKIRRSRTALFLYLIKKYAEEK